MNNATTVTETNGIKQTAQDLNNAMTQLKQSIADKDQTKADGNFTNADTNKQTAYNNAVTQAQQLIDGAPNVVVTPSEITDALNHVNQTKDELNGNTNLANAKQNANQAIDGLTHLTNPQKEALKQLEIRQTTSGTEASEIQLNKQESTDPTNSLRDNATSILVPTLTSETYIAATREVDKERFRVANLGRLKEVVFGAQDGILSTVALVTAVAVGVGASGTSTVLVAGLAAALAGMISMATGAYLGSRAEQDVQRSEIAREAQELEENPAEELAELVVIFQREGKSFAEAQALAEEISQDKDLWLNTLVEKELGISAGETTNPIKDGLVMGASFIIAALIPILPYFFFR